MKRQLAELDEQWWNQIQVREIALRINAAPHGCWNSLFQHPYRPVLIHGEYANRFHVHGAWFAVQEVFRKKKEHPKPSWRLSNWLYTHEQLTRRGDTREVFVWYISQDAIEKSARFVHTRHKTIRTSTGMVLNMPAEARRCCWVYSEEVVGALQLESAWSDCARDRSRVACPHLSRDLSYSRPTVYSFQR